MRVPGVLSWIARRVAILAGEGHDLEGIRVVDMTLVPYPNLCADIADALKLIHRYDSIRFNRMMSDVRRILIVGIERSAGEYWEDTRSVLLDAANCSRQTPEAVAMIIVHEATHARLWRMGVGRFPDRSRIERICVNAEIAFARKLPSSSRLIAGALAKLETRYWER
jgi:hypothetical protein